MMSESTPSTFSCVGGTECEPKKHSRRAYKRTRPDVAVDDAERSQGQGQQARRSMAPMLWGGSDDRTRASKCRRG